MLRYLVAALALAAPAAASALPVRVPPTDSCAQDRSFAAFRTALLAAIARKDAAFILAAATDDIQYSFGDDPGRAGFARAWGLARPATSALWRELAAALRLGCARDEAGEFWAPSMSLIGDENLGEEYYASAVAVGPGAALHAGRSDASRTIAPLRWHVVTAQHDDGASRWVRVRLADGREGYVRRALIRSFGDYRAVFAKRGGRWRLTAFVAGD